MKSKPFYSLKDLIITLGVEWDNTMQDVIPERGPLYYGSKDEVFTTDTNYRHPNHDTIEGWLLRYNKRYYSKKYDQWLTMAHCMSGTKDKLIGSLCTEEEKQRMIQWHIDNPDKIKANNDRNNSKPEHKIKDKEIHRAYRASEWMINHDIALTYTAGSRLFKSNTIYKWSTLQAYYAGSGGQTAAISDGWYKL